jgi:hypothetical protein
LNKNFYSTISFSPERRYLQQQQADMRQIWQQTIMMALFIARSLVEFVSSRPVREPSH